MIRTGSTRNLKSALTPSSYTILKEEINSRHFVRDISEFEKVILYNLRTNNISEIKKLPDVAEGLENAIKKASNSCNTISEVINAVSSKRYTDTRINRILLYSLLNITSKDMEISKKTNPYVRILGFLRDSVSNLDFTKKMISK